jgi:hypothetical protein
MFSPFFSESNFTFPRFSLWIINPSLRLFFLWCLEDNDSFMWYFYANFMWKNVVGYPQYSTPSLQIFDVVFPAMGRIPARISAHKLCIMLLFVFSVMGRIPTRICALKLYKSDDVCMTAFSFSPLRLHFYLCVFLFLVAKLCVLGWYILPNWRRIPTLIPTT